MQLIVLNPDKYYIANIQHYNILPNACRHLSSGDKKITGSMEASSLCCEEQLCFVLHNKQC